MKKILLVLAFVSLSPFVANAYVTVFGSTDVIMLAKLVSSYNVGENSYNYAVVQARVDSKTRSLVTPQGELNVVQTIGYVTDPEILQAYLDSQDTFPLKTADLLKMNKELQDYEKRLTKANRIPFAGLFVMANDPRYEISVKIQKKVNPLRTLLVSQKFPIYIDNLQLFEKSLRKVLSSIQK